MTSTWFLLAVMSLATFILTKLVVDLDFPPVLWLRRRVVGGWRMPTLAETYHERYPVGELEEGITRNVRGLGLCTLIDGQIRMWDTREQKIPFFFAELMSCPWCTAGWLAAGVTGGTWLAVGFPVPVLIWLAVWALGALLAQHDYA